MARPVTLFTGQWADLPLAEMARKAAEFGYEGLELACWGDHFEVDKALADDNYCRQKRELLDRHNLQCLAISNHLVGQAVLDVIDERHKAIVPPYVWGNGNPAGVNKRAAEELMNTARAAQKFGVGIVNGFTGSSIWPFLYSFPPVPEKMIEAGFELLAERFNPILDVFGECGVKFALEVHPTEIAFDLYTAERALEGAGLSRRVRLQLRPEPPALARRGSGGVHSCVPRPHLPRARERRDHDAQRQDRHPGQPLELRRRWPRLGFPQPWPRSHQFRGDHPSAQQDQLRRPAVDRMGRHGHGSRVRRREACDFTKRMNFAQSGRAFDAAFEEGQA